MKSDFNRIVLIGFRGSGKSTIGRLLSKKMGWDYISTDEQIENIERNTIDKIVEKKGWKYFRELEAKIVEKLEFSKNMIIDTGGGIVENQSNIKKLKSSSLKVWIDAEIDDIIRRLQKYNNRPLLSQDNIVEDTKFNYNKRLELYKRYSDLRFNTSIDEPENICDKIISEMRLK